LKVMADELVAKCREAGLTHFLFVRHANAAPLESSAPVRTDQPHDWRISDQRRVLTPKGHGQCEAAGEAWFSALPVRALLVSPARRASDTAVRMSAHIETEEKKAESLYLRMVEGVHPAGMNEACEIMFETRGYGPLRGFFDATYGEEGAVGRDAFSEYAAKVNAEMAAIIKGPSFTTETADATGSTCLAVFGHAVFLNAIAFQVAVAAGAAEAAQDALLDMDLGETEGILVNLVEGTIEHKKVA
jgi:broad specificity phosphatase PhoE